MSPVLRRFEWWSHQLREPGISIGEIIERDRHLVLDFEDGEGQRPALVDDSDMVDTSVGAQPCLGCAPSCVVSARLSSACQTWS